MDPIPPIQESAGPPAAPAGHLADGQDHAADTVDGAEPFPQPPQLPLTVEWLWPGWIPRGMLTFLAAAPGVGKSTVALDLARRIIHGLSFPDGAPVPCPGSNVLYVDAEGPLTLLNQRATAWGIDRSRLFVIMPKGTALFDLAAASVRKLLAQTVRLHRPSLVIVDSLGASTPGGESNYLALHTLLAVLPRLAGLTNCALLVIHHLRKHTHSGLSATATPVTLDDLRGTSHIVATARSVLALSPLSPDPFAVEAAGPQPTRRLEVIKANLCRIPPPLGLVLEGDDTAVPVVRYTGPLLPPPPPPTQLELCAHWLLDHLAAAGEPLRPVDLIPAAGQAGFSQTTLYRARRALGSRILDLGASLHDPARRWALPAPASNESPEPPPSHESP